MAHSDLNKVCVWHLYKLTIFIAPTTPNDALKNITMEMLIQRIPLIPENIFSQLKDQSLTKCKEVGKNWFHFINATKVPWIRIIKKYLGLDQQLAENWEKAHPWDPMFGTVFVTFRVFVSFMGDLVSTRFLDGCWA